MGFRLVNSSPLIPPLAFPPLTPPPPTRPPQTVLLQEKDLMPQVMQKVAAIFLMYEAHRPEPLTSNPLAPFLAELVQVQLGME